MNDALDAILRAGVDSGSVPGVVGIVVDRDGVRYLGAAGERSIGTGVAMTTDTVGAIFSMTKAVTGAAAMQLVEQGRIELDAPISLVCQEVADPVVLEGFDGDGQPITRPAASEPTMRQLLTHTSGFVYDIWNADMGEWFTATGTPPLFSAERAALRTPLAFDPGTQWQYGIGIDWAGLMVEAVTGVSLGEYFDRELFGPLGMVDTGFAHTESMVERAAALHVRLPDGSFTAIELPAPERPEVESGGGGLQSTLSDYGNFMRMILNDGQLNGRRILGADTVHEMCSNNIGPLRVTELRTAAPHLSCDAEMFPGEEKSWGLTFQIHEQPGFTGRPTGTLSWAGLANSYYWIDRTNGIAGAFLTQILPFADPSAIGLYYDFERAVYEHLA